jgi:hypothetical protein
MGTRLRSLETVETSLDLGEGKSRRRRTVSLSNLLTLASSQRFLGGIVFERPTSSSPGPGGLQLSGGGTELHRRIRYLMRTRTLLVEPPELTLNLSRRST